MDTVRRLWEDCFDSLNNKTAALSRTFNKKQRQKAAQQQPPQQINHPQVNHPQQINHPQQVNHPNDSLGGHNISININDTSNNRHEVDPPENDEEFESKYENLIADLGLDDKAKQTLLAFSREKKVKLYRKISTNNERISFYIGILDTYSKAGNQTPVDKQLETLERLKALLRSGRVSAVRDFLAEGGLEALLVAIETLANKHPFHRINEVAIGCLKNSMNCQEGRRMVLKSDRAVNVVAKMSISLLNPCEKARVVAIGILSGLCMVPGGHLKVLTAFNHLQAFASERCRFQTILRDLDCTRSPQLTIAILVFINSLINYGAGMKLLEFRLHLRYEFLMQGLSATIDRVKKTDNSLYDKHIDFYELVRKRDEKEFFDKVAINKKRVDSKSVSCMAEHLKQRHLMQATYPHLLSILYHLVLLPHGAPWTLQQWKLIDKLVKETAIPQGEVDTKEGINVKSMLSKLSQDEGARDTLKSLKDKEKELGEVKDLLQKKEKEAVSRLEEKKILLETLSELKRKLESEADEHRRQLDRKNEQIKELKKSGGVLSGLTYDTKEEDDNDEDRSRDGNSSTNSIKATTATLEEAQDSSNLTGVSTHPSSSFKGVEADRDGTADTSNHDSFTIPPPPVLPDASMPPPPPPPIFNLSQPPIRKHIPQPKQPTKCFNWSKVPHHCIDSSIWKQLSDQDIYQKIDLEELERKFSAYQRSQQVPQGSKTAAKELSLMDARRSQNCNIMLAKLKMSNDQLIEAVTTGDSAHTLSRDACEQLLKFLPTAEEASLLKDHEAESSQMARPDLFLFRISQVDHYDQMLTGITFKKKFNERVNDLSGGMKAVLEASQVCVKSTSLRRLLEVVLAVGNFLNGGSRGNAFGFKLSSLPKLQDTKSADHKFSLVHYLAHLCSEKFPETASLEEDLASTREASKVNLQEFDVEMKTLGTGLKQLGSQAQKEEERNVGFSVQMKEFLQVSTCRYDNVKELCKKMKKQYSEMLSTFCEDASVQPEECFKHIVALLDALSDANKENLIFKKQQEEEEAKALREAQMRSERGKRKFSSAVGINQEEDLGEFDAMIKTLMTGDAYDGNMGRGKRSTLKKLSANIDMMIDEEAPVNQRRTRPSKSLANILESRERNMPV